MRIVWGVINRKGGGCSMVILLLEFLFHISSQQNAVSLYTVLVLLRIWKLLIIPAFGEILRQCSARVTMRSAAVEKPSKGRHFHLAGVIWLINVGGDATEESTAAVSVVRRILSLLGLLSSWSRRGCIREQSRRGRICL